MRRLFRTILAAATTAVVVGAPQVPASASTVEATTGASWLAGQLTNGRIHNAQFAFDDWGLTLDTLFALESAGSQPAKVTQIKKALDNGGVDAYVAPGYGTVLSAGAVAKSLVAAEIAGANPRAFGRHDLIADLERLIVTSTGRAKDDFDNTGADYANTISQAFAVQGLAAAYSPSAASATSFLLHQQCAKGFFRLDDNDAKTCDAAGGKADTDVTSYAVQALVVAQAHGIVGADAALTKAVRWLASSQGKDGSHGGGVSTAAPNANSTALAATALAQLGNTSKARAAAGWVKSMQVTKAEGGRLGSQVGAVAYDAAAFNAGRSKGITADTRDQWQRTTTQAIVALASIQAPARPPVQAAASPSSTPKDPSQPTPAAKPAPAAPVSRGAATVATEPGASTPAGALGRYLATQLVDGTHVEVVEKDKPYVDYAMTADAVLALRVLRERPKIADSATAFLLKPSSIKAYANGAPYDTAGAAYAEPLSKLIWIASFAKENKLKAKAASFAARLESLQQPDGTFADRGSKGDGTAAVERQSWATMALAATRRNQAASLAASRLRAAQCSDGTFPAAMTGACASGDLGPTGIAMQALAARATGSSDMDSLIKAADAVRPIAIEDQGDFATVAAIAAGRQSVGVDPSRAMDYLGASELAAGGLPARAGLKIADLSTSVSAAPGVAGRSVVTAPGSPIDTEVVLPLADTTPHAKAPDDGSDDRANDPLVYTALGVFLAIVAFAIVQVTRRWFTRPRKAVQS